MGTQRKILVADDSNIIREMLRMILTKAGYLVVFAEDGKEAVDKTISEKPDLVITDGLLPKMHGFLACKAIKELEQAPKVILLTGVYTKPTYRWEVRRDYGADDLLIKPVEPARLLACIEKHLGEAPDTEVAFQEASEVIELKPADVSGFDILDAAVA
jgi:DNA-binding response OmpR family regulator